MNSVSANGYQIVVSTSQATAQADINIATIQVSEYSIAHLHSLFSATIYILFPVVTKWATSFNTFSSFTPSVI
jgi:hypothetical protein